MPITAVNSANFVAEVIEKSSEVPVLVDYWASWCAPCQAIAPMLEELDATYGERLAIAKVNADEERELVAASGVRGLPTLKLFRDGNPVRESVGLQPLEVLKQLIEPYLPEDSAGPASQAIGLVARGAVAEAEVLLREALETTPDDYSVYPVLATLLLDAGKDDEAKALLDSLPANEQTSDAVTALYARMSLGALGDGLGSPENAEAKLASEPAAGHYELGVHAALAGDYERALTHLLESVRADRGYDEEAARKLMVNLFQVMPEGDPLIRQFQISLARTLN